MRTIAIINQKGGCGKTTTAINLSAVLAQKGHRTLLVDMDPQSHCALGLAVPEAQVERSIADLMRNGLNGSISVTDIAWQIARNFDLAPSTMSLAMIEQEISNAPDKDRRLVQVLAPVADKYEFCIIDCPPSIGLLTFNALRAADEVIVPVETGYFALQGSMKQEATIEMLARRAGHHVRFKALATLYDVRTKLAREILSELRKHFGERLLPVVVHFNAKLKEAASFGQAITEYDPGSRGYQDFEKLYEWLLANPPVPQVVQAAQELDAQGEPIAANQGVQADGNAGVGVGAATGAGSGVVASTNPALTRAAELVERARVLSARTAELADRLGRDTDADQDGAAAGEETGSPVPQIATPQAAPPQTLPQSGPQPGPQPGIQPGPQPTQVAAGTNQSPQRAVATSPAGSFDRTPVSSTPQAVQEVAQQSMPPNPAAAVLEHAERPLNPKPTLSEKLAKLYGARITSQGLLFVQPGDANATQVYVSGDFNNWSRTDTPLQRNEELGVWQACVPVPPGRYRYRLIVNGKWKQDPFNSYVESNPFGELNNVVEVDVES